MLAFPQMDTMNSHDFLIRTSDPRGPPAFKTEVRQQPPQEDEIPIWAMAALKISRKQRPQRHQPYDLPSWGQTKTLTNQAENLISQQRMPRSPENIFVALLAFTSSPQLAPLLELNLLITLTGLTDSTPLYFRS